MTDPYKSILNRNEKALSLLNQGNLKKATQLMDEIELELWFWQGIREFRKRMLRGELNYLLN
jgi:hypothetical protein